MSVWPAIKSLGTTPGFLFNASVMRPKLACNLGASAGATAAWSVAKFTSSCGMVTIQGENDLVS